jgi:hypothetical protein
MSRVYSLQTILRQLPKPELGRFFERMKLPLDLSWNSLRPREIEPILEAFLRVPSLLAAPIEREFQRLHNLSCEMGLNAFIEAAVVAGDSRLHERWPAEGTPYERAIYVWLEHPSYFDDAELLQCVERLAWWRRRNDLPRGELRRDPASFAALARAVSEFLMTEQGRGRRCSVEYFRRPEIDYIFIHPDDFVQGVQTHDDDGRLTAQTIRRTFEIVFAYGRAEGTLELFAKLPGKLRPRLEEFFAAHLLDWDLSPWGPKTAFRLQHLLDPDLTLPVDPRDGVSVFLRRLRCQVAGSSRRLDFEGDPNLGSDDVQQMITRGLNGEYIDPKDLVVRGAVFTFEFLDPCKPRAARATVEVSGSGSCNLNHLRADRGDVIRKYLRRWGIDVREANPIPRGTPRTRTAAVA